MEEGEEVLKEDGRIDNGQPDVLSTVSSAELAALHSASYKERLIA